MQAALDAGLAVVQSESVSVMPVFDTQVTSLVLAPEPHVIPQADHVAQGRGEWLGSRAKGVRHGGGGTILSFFSHNVSVFSALSEGIQPARAISFKVGGGSRGDEQVCVLHVSEVAGLTVGQL